MQSRLSMRVAKKVSLVVLLFLLLQWSCSVQRREQVASTPSVAVEAPQLEEESLPEPDDLRSLRSLGVDRAIQDAWLLIEKGKEKFRMGLPEQGRYFFWEAQDMLALDQYAPEFHPRLEQAQMGIAGEIRRIEVMSLIGPGQSDFPLSAEIENYGSPLDEIADLDLYAIEVDPELEHLVSQDVRQTAFDFPVLVNEEVLRFLEYYQGRGREAVESGLRRSGRYLQRFKDIFSEENCPQDLVYMAHVESLFKPRAYSRASARGIWQFMAGTARLYDLEVGWWLDQRMDIWRSTRAAARHLRDLRGQFDDWYLALAAYNGGPNRVARILRRYGEMDYWEMADRRLLPRETRNFVPSILAAMIIYRNPEKYGFFVEPDPPLAFETVTVDYQVDLRVIAESIEVPSEELLDLNPELAKGITPYNGSEYELKVPVGKQEEVRQTLAALPEEKRLRLVHHVVRQGETLSHIASRYGVSIRAIAEVNQLPNIHRLSLRQRLVIPLSNARAFGVSAAQSVNGNHVVRRGESLYTIARHYGVTVQQLFRWNNLRPGDYIYPGQEIQVRSTRN